ncbi:hypothetical protein [Delftia lacustris]
MAKLLAWFPWFASALLIAGCYAQEKSPEDLLASEEVGDADFVRNWLQTNRHADQTTAQNFYQHGMKDFQRKAWSPAAKSFGTSMRLYPSPEALYRYVDVKLQMLAMVRKREGDIQEKLPLDMNYALKLYRSALSANMVLGTLSEEEKTRIENHVSCLQAYAAAGRPDMDCEPLHWYYNAAR